MTTTEEKATAPNAEEKEQSSNKTHDEKIDPRVEWITRLLDDLIRTPGGKFGVGLDGLLGLIPVVGDVITGVFGYWVYREAKRLGVPPSERAKIIALYAMDIGVGLVPLLGDALDFVWRANRMSLDIIEKHLERTKEKANTVKVDAEVKEPEGE